MSEDRVRYREAAVIALADAARTQDGFDVGQQLARAQVYATLASAEQSRLANLIAWKQLRQTQSASTSTLPNAGDAISDEIEDALGITDTTTEEQS